MPLIFPNNPTLGQTYQSGSSGVFVYNGEAWDSQNASVPTLVPSASFSITSSVANFATRAATYTLPETLNTGSWIQFGTWDTIQNGQSLYMRITSKAGYNATTDQNQVTEMYFKTSNGVSSQGGFFGDGLAAINRDLGTQTQAPSS